MLLAGKSEATHSFSATREDANLPPGPQRLGTFSFDKQNSGVGVGRRLHFSEQSFFLFVFFFFRLQTPQHQLQLIPFNSSTASR